MVGLVRHSLHMVLHILQLRVLNKNEIVEKTVFFPSTGMPQMPINLSQLGLNKNSLVGLVIHICKLDYYET